MIEPVVLENEWVTLEPIGETHAAGLALAGADRHIWNYIPVILSDEDAFRQFYQYAKQTHEKGEGLCFVIRDPSQQNQIVGSTGYWNADLTHRRIEIGFTWLTPASQRSPINTACKRLLIGHAFEKLEMNRVEFKTDSLNERSRKALERIGAKEEGCLRNHMVMPDGRLRHSVYFSIIREEWPEVKKMLEEKLAQ